MAYSPDLLRHFDSVQDLYAEAMGPQRCSANAESRAVVTGKRPLDWFCADRHFSNGLDAIEAVRRGDFEVGRNRVAALASTVEAPEAISVRRRQRWEDQGDEVDQQRIWSGNLDQAWRRARRISTRGAQRIRVAIDLCVSAGTASSAMAWRGVAGLALADRLVEAGHNVEIIAFSRQEKCAKDGSDTLITITMKSFDAPLDIGALANLTASAAFFRGLLFTWWFTAPTRPITRGLGPVSAPRREELLGSMLDNVFIVPPQVLSKSAAEAWLTKVINEVNAQARGEIAA